MKYDEQAIKVENICRDKSIKWIKCSLINFLTNNNIVKGDLILKESYYNVINNIKIIKKITENGIEGWIYSSNSNYVYRMPSLLINNLSKIILINNLRESDMSYRTDCSGVSREFAYCLQKEFEHLTLKREQSFMGYKLIMASDFLEKETLVWSNEITLFVKNYIENDTSINSINNDYYKDYYEKQLKNNKVKLQATIDLFKNSPKRKLVDFKCFAETYMFDIFWIFDYLNNNKQEYVIKNELEIISRSNPNYNLYKLKYIDTKVNNELRLKLESKPSKLMKTDKKLLDSIKDIDIFIIESKKLDSITVKKTDLVYNSFYSTVENSEYKNSLNKYEKITNMIFRKRFPYLLDITKITDINGKLLYTL